MLDRFEVIGESDQPRRLEWPPLHAKRIDDRFEIRRRAQWKPGMIGEEPNALTRSLLSGCDGSGIGQGVQLREALVSGRRHREGGDGFYDAIEFERAKSTGIHGLYHEGRRATVTKFTKKPFSRSFVRFVSANAFVVTND